MSSKILILYGTETGNSELLAMDAEGLAKSNGFDATINGMDEISFDEIQAYGNLLIVCSTWGDGEQPDNAVDLFEAAEAAADDSLAGVNFAVLALGDTAFDLFCEAGIQWDDVIEAKGGIRINNRIDCDTDYEDEAEEWLEETIGLFSENAK
jgi:sulfite reductase (NADPH) flavoprotein alpha-component